MERRTGWGIAAAVFAIVCALLIGTFIRSQEQYCSVSFPVMGTIARVSLYTDRENFAKALDAVKAEFQRVNEVADLHSKTSEISQLNRLAAQKPFVCSPEMWEILREARRAYKLSEGAFDISVKPLMDLWGFYRKRSQVPQDSEIAAAKALTGLDRIIFDDAAHTIKFTRKGMAADLGGIAKGYAIEKAARAVIRLGISSGVLDLGGNLRLLPEPPPGRDSYKIGIRRPVRKKGGVMPEILSLPGGLAVSSSGDYERYVILGGKTYGHIIDPATGIPALREYAVTSVSNDGSRSDWISTAVFLRGEKMAEKLKKILPETDFCIIKKNGK